MGRKVEKIIGRIFPYIFTSGEDSGDFKFQIKIHVFPINIKNLPTEVRRFFYATL